MAEIRLVGTAHVSAKSIDDVRAAIEEFQPGLVAVELDQGRYKAMTKQARDPTVEDVLEVKNFNQLLVQWLLSYLQRKIGMDIGVEPGAEMKAAIEEAERHGIPVEMVDRDIRVTLTRFWQSLGFIGKIKMFYALVLSIAEVDNVEASDIEKLKEEDVMDVVMDEFRKFSPSGASALIDERDAYIAHNLVRLKEEKAGRILAVVGAGHLHGINRYLEDPGLPSFLRIPDTAAKGISVGHGIRMCCHLPVCPSPCLHRLFRGRSERASLCVHLLGDHTWGACCSGHACCGWSSLHNPYLFRGRLDDIIKPASSCRLDCCICRGKSKETTGIRFPQDLPGGIDQGNDQDPALPRGPDRSGCQPRKFTGDGPLLHISLPCPSYRPRCGNLDRDA